MPSCLNAGGAVAGVEKGVATRLDAMEADAQTEIGNHLGNATK